jgi:two-component system, OmpR family, phosphate regulon sensor histidine kinase PhoR
MPEKVLIIDDSQDIRDLLVQYILKPKGFDILIATNGVDGLELATIHKPDLMICDNQMPRMSGLELIRELRDRELNIPIILTTAFGSEEVAVEAFRLGVRDYVIKPFDTSEINNAVEKALRESRLEYERDQLLQQVVQSNSQLERQVQELNTLYQIGRSVTSSLNLETVLHRVVDAAVFISNAEEGSLMLLDPQQGELYVRASKNMDSVTRSIRLRTHDSLAGQVLSNKRPLIIGADDRWQKIKSSYLVKSLIYVPLIAQDKAIGVLSVANRTRDLRFNSRETRVLSTLADYAALAIYNAELYFQTDTERRKVSTILKQTDDPVLVVDEQGDLILANDAARIALEMPGGELTGQPVNAVIQNEEVTRFIKQAPGRNFSRRGEVRVADGRYFNINMTLMKDVGRSIMMRDITQLKELDNLKSEFVAVVSHDLRSPLTAILGYVQLMERAGPLTETQKEYIGRVQASVGNITSLITDLLDLGRLEAGLDLSLAPCSPREILLEIVEELKPNIQNKNLKLSLDMLEDAGNILGDRNRLHQAFSNLFNNAIKYTPECGSIIIKVVQQEGQLVVQIADSGIGIPPGDQPYIFDKFFRAENALDAHEGTGLGLTIVKSVIERHLGRIWLTSETGKGTTFTVVLPTLPG